MNGQMDEVGVGPVSAVIDDPEHAFGRGVELDSHNLIENFGSDESFLSVLQQPAARSMRQMDAGSLIHSRRQTPGPDATTTESSNSRAFAPPNPSPRAGLPSARALIRSPVDSRDCAQAPYPATRTCQEDVRDRRVPP